jgi:hypothetical protein
MRTPDLNPALPQRTVMLVQGDAQSLGFVATEPQVIKVNRRSGTKTAYRGL